MTTVTAEDLAKWASNNLDITYDDALEIAIEKIDSLFPKETNSNVDKHGRSHLNPGELFLKDIKSLINNLLIDNPNYNNGYYYRGSLISDLIKDTKERAGYVLERIENLKHLVLDVENTVNEIIYWHHPECDCVGICESIELFKKMVREEPALEEITEELYIKLKRMYEK